MRIFTHAIFAALVSVLPSIAMAEIPPGEFDRNGDKFLSDGEIADYKAALAGSSSANDAARYELLEEKEQLYSATGQIPVRELSIELKRIPCDFSQRIFLRRTVIDLPLADCQGLRPKSDGAAFAFTNDREAGTTKVAVEGGIGLVLLPARTLEPNRDVNPESFHLVDIAVSAFTEGDGTFETGKADSGHLRTGVKADWLFAGLGLERLAIATAGYYQSDLGLDSSGYGVQLTAVPQNSSWKLNASTRGRDDEIDFVIRARATLDAFHVDDVGTTALARGNYAWLGGVLGFELVDRTTWKNGIVLKSGVDAFWDVANGQDAVQWLSSLDFLLDSAGSSAFGFEYKRGSTRQNPVFQDVASMKLKLKF